MNKSKYYTIAFIRPYKVLDKNKCFHIILKFNALFFIFYIKKSWQLTV